MSFSERAGATALRPDLVRALSFSPGGVRLRSGEGPTRAALASVWNGEQGAVVVLLATADAPAVRRFEFDLPIGTPAALEAAAEAGREFAAGLGLPLDAEEFGSLDPSERRQRLAAWNALRKPGPPAAPPERASGPATGPPAGGPPAASDAPAVLGRIALVRRGRRSALAKVLGDF